MPVLISILLALAILIVVCFNTLDKWRFRADRQYPYVRDLMEEWEAVTIQLLDLTGAQIPTVRVAGQKHPWEAVAAANRLAAACPAPDKITTTAAPLLARQTQLEEELEVFLEVYNGLVRSYNKALRRPIIRQLGRLVGWQPWEPLQFTPTPSV